MPRPIGITVTAILMVVNLLMDVGHIFVARIARNPTHSTHLLPHSNGLLILHVALSALVLMEFVMVAYYWMGRSWARWAVLCGCIFYLASLSHLREQWQGSRFAALLGIGAGLLALFLLWYLHTNEVREWFRGSPYGGRIPREPDL